MLIMETADCETGPTFKFIWTIENLSELTLMDFKSPTFVVKSMGDTKWYLETDESFNIFGRIRTNDTWEEKSNDIDFEFSFLGADGSPLITKTGREPNLHVFLMRKTNFLARWTEFIQNNALTIQCRMWRSDPKISTDVCYARTRLKTTTESFIWAIEEFSSLRSTAAKHFLDIKPDERKIYPLKPVTEKGPFLALVLYLKQNSESEDVCACFLLEKGRHFTFGYELSLLDANGKVIVSKVERARVDFGLKFFLGSLISKNKLKSNKKLFLPNDTLVLRCSFEVCHGVISNELEYFTPNVSSVVEVEEESKTYNIARAEGDDFLKFAEYFVK